MVLHLLRVRYAGGHWIVRLVGAEADLEEWEEMKMANEKTLIYKEDLLNTVLDHFGMDLAYYGKDLQFCQEAIDMAPAVDAVEVVRCKDCKHCKLCYPEKQIDKEATPGWYCKEHKSYRKPDDFCSYGERKDNEKKAD